MSRTYLPNDTTWYAAVTGDNSWAGDSQNPWKSPFYSMEKIQRDYDMAGFLPALQLYDSTNWAVDSGNITFLSGNGPCVGANGNSVAFNILGNQANPSNNKINLTAGQYGFASGNSFVGGLYGFEFVCPTSVAGAIPILAASKGSWDIGDINFNGNYQQVNVYAVNGGTIYCYNTLKLLGNMGLMFASQAGSNIQVASVINIPSARTFAYFGQSIDRSGINFTSATYTGAGVSGCVGTKGYAQLCSDILVNDNFTTSAPGNTAYGHDTTSGIS